MTRTNVRVGVWCVKISKVRGNLFLKMTEKSRHSYSKFVSWADQAQDEISVTREVVEMSRMHEHGMLANEFDGQVFV